MSLPRGSNVLRRFEVFWSRPLDIRCTWQSLDLRHLYLRVLFNGVDVWRCRTSSLLTLIYTLFEEIAQYQLPVEESYIIWYFRVCVRVCARALISVIKYYANIRQIFRSQAMRKINTVHWEWRLREIPSTYLIGWGHIVKG